VLELAGWLPLRFLSINLPGLSSERVAESFDMLSRTLLVLNVQRCGRWAFHNVQHLPQLDHLQALAIDFEVESGAGADCRADTVAALAGPARAEAPPGVDRKAR